jgi:hypothetical protein
MSIIVQATQGGASAPSVGMALMVRVLTGAGAIQPGAVHGVIAPGTVVPSDSIASATGTGSLVYGALLGGNVAFTALSGTTFISNINNNGLRYIAFRSTTTTTASASIGPLGASGSTSGISVSLCEILTSGTLAEVTSGGGAGPAVASTAVATNVSTAAFTPATGTLLVAMVSCNGASGNETMTITDSSGLTWTEQSAQHSAGHAYSGVWTAPVTARAPPPSSGLLALFG